MFRYFSILYFFTGECLYNYVPRYRFNIPVYSYLKKNYGLMVQIFVYSLCQGKLIGILISFPSSCVTLIKL